MHSRRAAATIIVAAAALAACNGGDSPSTAGGAAARSSTTSSSDAGPGGTSRVSPGVIGQCGESGAAAATALQAYLTGSQSAEQTAQSLDTAHQGLSAAASAATAEDPLIGQAMQVVSDAVGQAQAGLADGSLGPFSATKLVLDALKGLPQQYCK